MLKRGSGIDYLVKNTNYITNDYHNYSSIRILMTKK